ncbi:MULTISPECIES: glycosyltransferase family A protein [Altibacter]|uniref:glycosyltransferase family 2 protein n=1 Tax=Altibacter TaxID=1535231 RepID=UPI00054F4DF8|nr:MULTISPECIES: glycosyltransferase family A protein [Altibacter]MCW9037495.1 glycosyltransferase family 2 protein [Altibacter sp.]
MPKFSVIIPLYNKERDIEKTLSSVFLQSESDFELVIVNDGSTDGSEAIVTSYDDPRIRYFSKDNEGVARTRNFGVAKANAEHIAFLDADDYWHSNHLENLNSLIEDFPEARWYATAYEKKHNRTLITPMISPILESAVSWKGPVDNYFKYSLMDALAWTSAVCFKKTFFQELNGFDATITHGAGEDTDLWIRAALRSPLVFSSKITARHNLDGSNRISNLPTRTRNYMDPSLYEDRAAEDPYFKRYLDLNRYSFAIQHRLAGDEVSFQKYVTALDNKNLTARQRYLLKQPKTILRLLLKSKAFAESLGFRLTSFK